MRLIDADKLFPDVMKVDGSMAISKGQLARAKTVEAIPKADYENRLKADMVAMLEELKLEFEEYDPKWAENEDQVIASNRTWDDFDDIIQQKIDALKAEEQQGENTEVLDHE